MPVEPWYPIPIYHSMVDDSKFDQIQTDFLTAFDDLKSKDKFQHRPGWEKGTHLLHDPNFLGNLINDYNMAAFATEVKRHVIAYMKQAGSFGDEVPDFVIGQCWMTLTLNGQYAHKHAHGHADLSGAYYVKTTGNDGDLYFEHPNKQLLQTSVAFNDLASKVVYKPQVGRLVMFPGWLEHGVFENKTDSERVSVSFNIYFQRLYKLDIY